MSTATAVPGWHGVLVALPNVGPAVREALLRPSACVPSGSIVLSTTSSHHAALRELQFERLERCFRERVVTVCYGPMTGANASCAISAPGFPPSAFRRAAYHEIIWAKWRFLHEALQHASEALFVDTDVVLFRNPFDALRQAPRFDIRFQGELACATTCEAGRPPPFCRVNGGVLLLRNAEVARAVILREPPFARFAVSVGSGGSGGGSALRRGGGSRRGGVAPPSADDDHGALAMLDQDVADDVVRASGQFTSCPLPSDAFVGYCSWAWGYHRGNRSAFDALRPCELVSYHAHCILSAKDKLKSMRRMLEKTAHCKPTSTKDERAAHSGERLGRWGPRAPPQATSRPRGKPRAGTKPRAGSSSGRQGIVRRATTSRTTWRAAVATRASARAAERPPQQQGRRLGVGGSRTGVPHVGASAGGEHVEHVSTRAGGGAHGSASASGARAHVGDRAGGAHAAGSRPIAGEQAWRAMRIGWLEVSHPGLEYYDALSRQLELRGHSLTVLTRRTGSAGRLQQPALDAILATSDVALVGFGFFPMERLPLSRLPEFERTACGLPIPSPPTLSAGPRSDASSAAARAAAAPSEPGAFTGALSAADTPLSGASPPSSAANSGPPAASMSSTPAASSRDLGRVLWESSAGVVGGVPAQAALHQHAHQHRANGSCWCGRVPLVVIINKECVLPWPCCPGRALTPHIRTRTRYAHTPRE